MATRDMNTTFKNGAGISPRPIPRDSLWQGGALTGITAGLIMALIAMIFGYVMGMDFWLLPKMIAATFLGADALTGGVGSVILGLIVHLVVAAAYGILFAFLTPRITSPSSDFGLGIAYGVIIWAVMTFIVLPLFNDLMRERVALIPFTWFINHLVFGASLAMTPYFERIVDPVAYKKAISRSTPTSA